MNPPSALNSAMSRDRKPFTYTPGGLDLSQIKSPRMAQRLMRNAMNPGVPEVPVHPVQPSGVPTVPVALPNYNCMPVQVFPAMPANPKSLLRTRSNPDPRDAPIQRVNPPAFVNNTKFENNDTLYKNTATFSQQLNNNRHMSMYEYNTPPVSTFNASRLSYGSDGYTAPVTANLPTPVNSAASAHMPSFAYAPVKAPVPAPVFIPTPAPAPVLPEISYDAEFFRIPRDYSEPINEQLPKSETSEDKMEFFRIPRGYSESQNEQLPKFETYEDVVPANDSVATSVDLNLNPTADVTVSVRQNEATEKVADHEIVKPAHEVLEQVKQITDVAVETSKDVESHYTDTEVTVNTSEDVEKQKLDAEVTVTPIPEATIVNSVQEETVVSIPIVTKSLEENAEFDNEQSEVKVVKKQVTSEKKVEEQNGDQNGDTNGEAEMIVKLPSKKSSAKTETKVEVERKILPDGSVEEVKTTITKTTIDGRTEIKTKKETTIIPKEEESEEEVVEEEEEQEVEEQQDEPTTVTVIQTVSAPKENGNVTKTEERSETTIAKKVVVVQEAPQPEEAEEEDEVEEEEVVESEPVTIVLKKQPTPEPAVETKSREVEEEEEEEEEERVEKEEVKQEVVKEEVKQEIEEKEEEEGETEVEQEKVETKTKEVAKEVPAKDEEEKQEEEEEYEEAEEKQDPEEKTEVKDTEQQKEEVEVAQEKVKEEAASEEPAKETKEVPKEEERVIPIQIQTTEEPKPKEKSSEFTIPIREPSIPLDKVEDVEIKPIGITPIITKTHTENTEIITSTIDPAVGLSKQTEYNKIENIVTVNRTTKILDHSYENMTQQGIPTVKTYFPPPSIDRITTSPMPSRPYQPVYPPEPTTERRHSLLLDRLSMERQMPSDIYQYQSTQTYDQTQYQGEPQSEVLTVSNVKPSTITNQQWYQQNKQTQNVLYNNVTSNPAPVGAPWAQPKSPQPQQQYQPPPQQQYQPPSQPQYQAQYQPPPQPQFQRGTTPQPQFQRGTTPQPQYQKATTPQPQYQPSYSEPARDKTPTNNYATYTPTPTWVASAVESAPTPYSYHKDTTQSYQKNTSTSSTTQQYSSGYVPPPWEQDSSYTSASNTIEKYYQEAPQTNTYNPAPSQGWKPPAPPAKYTKNAPIAYVPPAPNQSFVRSAANVEPPKQPGRKTYYSEYERRYISVPDSTYIPTETKFQHQPDPSPQYYYDNNEPSETVEPQWRKELREFTEKTSQTQTTETTNVQPPWEVDSKYAKTPSSTYTPTPTWSQTLRPQSYRERSFESEYVSQEWPKTNTLGRGRPLSTMGKSVDSAVQERARGVSVDRYNPNSYQPPAEHPLVQSHTLTTPVPHAGYHNPNVPAYHARASAEPREQPANYQQRVYRESRASPLQSRSFKYLQWITGTEN